MARDVQVSKVYAWERTAYPDHMTKDQLTPREARALIARVHADVNAAGGRAPVNPVVKFTKRSGAACASWNVLNFTPTMITRAIVLHEIAHSLTWFPAALVTASVKVRQNLEVTADERYALEHFCDQGHGPRWVGCYIALMERYSDYDAKKAVTTAALFRYQGWGPWHTVGTSKASDGRLRIHKERKRETRVASIRVSIPALNFWRNLLKEPA